MLTLRHIAMLQPTSVPHTNSEIGIQICQLGFWVVCVNMCIDLKKSCIGCNDKYLNFLLLNISMDTVSNLFLLFNFCWIKVYFVGPLIVPILDFM